MSKLKTKKLILQHAYLKVEEQEVSEICLSHEPEIRAYMEKHYPETYGELTDPPNSPQAKAATDSNQEPTKEAGTEQQEDENPEISEPTKPPPKNKDLKKLYRKIAEKTHPDKVGADEYPGIFSKAAQAYANNNIAALLDLASSLNIEMFELSEESILSLEKNVKQLSLRIINSKKSVAWAWHLTKSEEEKMVIINNIFKEKGIIQ